MLARKLSTKEISVESWKTVGEKQLQQFVIDLPDDISAAVSIMKELNEVILKVNEVEEIDISLIYSRVISLQLTNQALKVENIFSFELSPVPTSMFDDTDDMRSAKSKSIFNNIIKKNVILVN